MGRSHPVCSKLMPESCKHTTMSVAILCSAVCISDATDMACMHGKTVNICLLFTGKDKSAEINIPEAKQHFFCNNQIKHASSGSQLAFWVQFHFNMHTENLFPLRQKPTCRRSAKISTSTSSGKTQLSNPSSPTTLALMLSRRAMGAANGGGLLGTWTPNHRHTDQC